MKVGDRVVFSAKGVRVYNHLPNVATFSGEVVRVIQGRPWDDVSFVVNFDNHPANIVLRRDYIKYDKYYGKSLNIEDYL